MSIGHNLPHDALWVLAGLSATLPAPDRRWPATEANATYSREYA